MIYNISLTNLKAGIFSSAHKVRNPKNKDIHTSTAWLDCGICHSKSKLHMNEAIQDHVVPNHNNPCYSDDFYFEHNAAGQGTLGEFKPRLADTIVPLTDTMMVI